MIKVTMDVNGTTMTYDISTMETLAKFQAQLTEDFFKHYSQEISDDVKSKIIDEFLDNAEEDYSARCDLVERITNNMIQTNDDIIARALEDTDYDTIDEITEAVDGMRSDMEEIYSYARNWC